jgi:phosphoribosylformimino-5-aminoimidazole carboxamide ribotide isomerase
MKNVAIKPSRVQGKGIFALRNFQAGEKILEIDDSHIVEDVSILTKDDWEYNLDFVNDKIVLMQEPERCINHSCDPNSYVKTIQRVRTVLAKRAIVAGEEITYDYAVNGDNDGTFPCQCGAARCRRIYTGNYFKLPLAVQREYLPYLDDWFVDLHKDEINSLNIIYSGKAMSLFTIFPAIDLRAGKIVRLAQGDPTRQTEYGDDPCKQAEQFKAEGAEWIHVINLSGAFGEDAAANLKALEAILSVGLKVEFGGGIRNEETIRIPLEMGAERVFLGTAAIQNPALVDWAIARYGPGRIAADIGVRDGQVMVKGWQESTPLTMLEAGKRFKAQGLEWCVLTDVRRDGVGSGVSVDSADELQSVSGLKVVASGGVSSLEDVQKSPRSRFGRRYHRTGHL